MSESIQSSGSRRASHRGAGLLLSCLVLSIFGCSDSGGDDTTGFTITPPPVNQGVLSRFIDDDVYGLDYESTYQTGSTGQTGTFRCDGRADTATFSLGELIVGTTECAEVVSPVDLLADGHTRHPVVMAIAALIQSLDGDGDRANGVITITPEVVAWVEEAAADLGLTGSTLADLEADEIISLTRAVVALSRANASPDDDLIYITSVVAAEHLEAQLAGEGLFSYYVQEAYLDEQAVQIGGASTSVARFEDEFGQEWAVFNVAHRLSLTPVQASEAEIYRLPLGAFIHDIQIVEAGEVRYALVALGGGGISVVDISDPAMPLLLHTVTVNYYQDGLIFAEGGGALVTDFVIEGSSGSITSLVTDGVTLWIGDHDYGIHRTALTNLLAAAPVTEADGTLAVDHEVFTLQYAGEHAWGGPSDLQLHNGDLYVAQGFLGVGVYDPDTLNKIGYYNMFTDTSVTEDWFVDRDVATEVQTGFVDPETGMPTYDQASYEILEVWRNDVDAPTPWADFDRYGKFYYDARALDVAEIDGGGGTETRVFVAYGLGGVVALNVDDTDPADLQLSYLGYAPAVPANGPDKPRQEKSRSLFPYFGVGMLKEAGAVDVAVDPATNRLYYTDHFAGLVVLEGADDPATNWRQEGAPFDNDTIGVMGDHWPDYEFVTSYDMGAYDPEDNESLPVWMYTAPSLLVTGEISGHGNSFALMPALDSASGNTDVLLTNGSGGMNFVDLRDLDAPLLADRFAVVLHFPTTDEIGAAADGTATADVSIGHTQGVAVKDGYLYVADGPHGMSVWDIEDTDGLAIDDPHLIANTLMEEYPEEVNGTAIYPTPHAYNVVMGSGGENAFVLSQSLGLRRVDITGVDAGQGQVGAPLLFTPQPSDFFEHNTPSTNYFGLRRQDHAYDVDFYENYAVVADGSNGLTFFDLSADPTGGNHVVGNLGAESGEPGVGRASGVEIWTDYQTGRVYAFVAAGHAGVGVVDVTGMFHDGDPTAIELIKLFEPIKLEIEDDGEVHVGKASSRSVDVDVVDDKVYFTYGDFGVLAYSIDDLLEPLPEGVEPNQIWGRHLDFDYRPEALAQFVITNVAGLENLDAESLYMVQQQFRAGVPLHDDTGDYQLEQPRLLFYIAYGGGGVAKIDWSDPANPELLQYQDTVGEATGTAVSHGRVYVADGSGGLSIFRQAAE